MKITTNQLRRIIKEEVKRAKRVNLHEIGTEMVDDDLGNAVTQAVKDAISNTIPGIDVHLDDVEISARIEDFVADLLDSIEM